MKISIKIRVIPLMLTLFLITSGCANHSLSNTTDSESTSTSTTGTILDKTDTATSSMIDTNNTTKTTVNVEKILEDQRSYLEHEKALQEDLSIAAKVNETLIYQWQIESKVNGNNANLKNYRVSLDTMDLSEQQREQLWEAYRATLLMNKKDILNELIRNTVIQKEIDKRGLFPTDEEVITKAQEQLANIKKTPDMYASAQLYMEVMSLSEEDYLRLIIDEHKNAVGRANLYQQITAKVDTETEKNSVFTAAVDEWISQADIKILINQE